MQPYGYDAKNKLTSAADPSGVADPRVRRAPTGSTKVTRGDEVFDYAYDDDDRVNGAHLPGRHEDHRRATTTATGSRR